MTKAIKYTTAVFYLFLIFLLITSVFKSYFGDIAGNTVYIIGTAMILLFGLSASKRLKTEREQEKGLIETAPDVLIMDRRALGTTLLLAAPIIGVIFLVSYLTSLILWTAGLQGSEVEMLPLFDMLVVHALLPSLAEEVIFRLIPILLLRAYNPRWCIAVSSLGFAFIHLDLFQIPYALFAGVLFMGIDLLTDSLWPSVIIHFLNNSVSVIWLLYCTDMISALILVSVLAVLSVIGLAVVFVKRKHYGRLCREKLRSGEPCKNILPFASLIAVSLFIAVTNMLI